MSGKVTSARATNPFTGASVRVARDDIRPVSGSESASAAARPDLRLIIEESGEAGRYIYTLVDRRTGRIVSQLPREHVLKLKDQTDYAAGALVDGEAEGQGPHRRLRAALELRARLAERRGGRSRAYG